MSTPLYVCGLAQPGKDGPFHVLDAQLRIAGHDGLLVTGEDAAIQMFGLALDQHHMFPLPHLCPIKVEEHKSCSPATCTHDGQCSINRAMWRNPAKKEKTSCNYYAGELSDGLAQHLINFYVDDTERMRQHLAATLQLYGDVILKKWEKMTTDARGSLLARVSGRVFGSWPAKVGTCTKADCFEEHSAYWTGGPWLNSRDLADDWMKLVSALHVRTAHDAASWTTFDARNLVAAWDDGLGGFSAWFNSGCVLLCDNDYASLVEFDSELCHEYAAIGFPRAFMTFQAQHELMYTLQNITDVIINGSQSTGSTIWDALVEEGLHSARQDVAWSTYTHQAFTDPESVSPQLLARKADDRLRMIKDELFLMQTNPAYMQEIIKSKRVAISNISTNLRRTDQLNCAGALFMIEHLNRYIIWQTISSSSHKLAEAFEHYGSLCRAGTRMPREVSDQMQALGSLLNESFRAASGNFQNIVFSTEAFRHHFRANLFEGHLYINEGGRKLDHSKPADRLRWRIKKLRELAAAEVNQLEGGCSLTLGLALREEEAAQIMDEPTREYLSDMMLIDDIRTLLSFSQHGRARLDEHPIDETRWKPKDGHNGCVHDDPNCRPPKLKFGSIWMQRVGVLIQSFMDAPWPNGRRDLIWLDKANKTRGSLACLWKGIAAEYEKAEAAGNKTSACGKHLIASITAFDEDAEYKAALEHESSMCAEKTRKLQAAADEARKNDLDYVPQTEWGLTPAHTLSHKPIKLKSSRTEPVLERALEALDIAAVAPSFKEETIAVKKESLAVFRKMFRADSDCLAGGSVRWQAFFHAMKDAGFSAEQTSGSAATFKHISGGSISFHRPHPDPVLDHIMLFSMAKRLTKWFGFSAERFVLRKKNTDEKQI